MSGTVPTVLLNNGHRMPVLGLGTSYYKDKVLLESVKAAIDAGYRHVDTADYYQNEKEVGQAIRDKILDGIIKREDMFVTTKLWSAHHAPESVPGAFQKSLDNLGLEYVDLFLIHFPGSFDIGNDGKITFLDTDYVDTWGAMERLLDTGKVRSIGVSNFNSEQLTRLLEHATVKPVTNQVECSPGFNQKKLIRFCKERDITITAYSPLGRPYAYNENPELFPKPALDEPLVLEIAKKYGKTSAQIILRYLIDVGVIPIPKSGNPTRLRQNIDIFDFQLTAEELSSIDTLHTGQRVVKFDPAIGHRYYPFDTEF